MQGARRDSGLITIGLYNIKGGVGKSTTAVCLACLAAAAGEPTLLWDLDPQGAAGYYLGSSGGHGKGTGRLVKGKERLEGLASPTRVRNLDLVPARFSYRRLDLLLKNRPRPRKVLWQLLSPLVSTYRWVFLDCPPGIGLLSENVFHAVDLLLVPVVPTPLSLRAFEEIVVFFRKKGYERERLLPFFSLVERRRRIHRSTMEVFAAREPAACRAFIPALSDIERMAVTRRPVVIYRPRSEASRAFEALWREVRQSAESHP